MRAELGPHTPTPVTMEADACLIELELQATSFPSDLARGSASHPTSTGVLPSHPLFSCEHHGPGGWQKALYILCARAPGLLTPFPVNLEGVSPVTSVFWNQCAPNRVLSL